MRVLASSALILGLASTACSSSDESSPAPASVAPASPAAAEPALPANLAKVPCRFAIPTSPEGSAYQCYDLAVPENRSVATSRTIKVHAIAFRGKAGGTPTFELNGGPGGPSEDLALGLAVGSPSTKESIARFLEVGDYVLIDQRGTGRSIPRLTCTESEMGSGASGGKSCADRHTKAGVDLTGFVTSENAEDVHDLKVALGAAKVNLHSISYGTRLALELLRRHPEDVATAIIDGVMPAQVKALTEGDLNMDKVLTGIFTACAADAACKAAYPDPEKALVDLKTKLDTTPFTFEGAPYGWEDFAGNLLENLSGDFYASEVPFSIYDMLGKNQAQFEKDFATRWESFDKAHEQREAELAKTELGREAQKRMGEDSDPDASGMADGMYLSIVCSDFVQYESLEEAMTLEKQVRPAFQSEDRVQATWDVCTHWPKRAKTNDVWAAVASDLPVLAVAGAFDPLTPVSWRDLASSTLTKSQKVTMGAGAHGALDGCAMGIKMAFYAGLPIDASCAEAQKVDFVMPGTVQKLPLRRHLVGPGSRVPQALPLSPIAIAARLKPQPRRVNR